ncbi:MAG: EutN/CcmL family microcompartment protein [Acidobacteria bacterium]|nr:EutN/CcmL family microcompartment protein [Acidobacteriota bacterium]
MFIGTVVGRLWSTKKVKNLQSLRFLLIRPENLDKEPNTSIVVVADILGAGVGEKVMIAYGRAARLAIGDEDASIEAAVVGIIDNMDVSLDLSADE